MLRHLFGVNDFFWGFNSNNANYYGIIMMSQINAPIHSYKTLQIYYQRPKIWQKMFGNFFGIFFINFFLANQTRYIDSDFNLRSPFNFNFENSKGNSLVWKIVWKI